MPDQTDVASQPVEAQIRADLRRRRLYAAVQWALALLFVLAVALLSYHLGRASLRGRPLEPAEALDQQAIVLAATLITSVVTLLGFISTTVLAWRKERRDAETTIIALERQRLEIEKLRLDLERERAMLRQIT